jgi:hypothetical protein
MRKRVKIFDVGGLGNPEDRSQITTTPNDERFLLGNIIDKIVCGDQSNESSSHLERIGGVRIDMTSFVLEQSKKMCNVDSSVLQTSQE